MQKRSFVVSVVLLCFGLLAVSCNMPGAIPAEVSTPTLVPAPIDAPQTGDTTLYTDLTTLVYVAQEGAPFWLYQTMVSNQQYALCVATGACAPPDTNSNPAYEDAFLAGMPVAGVTFEQAQTYCQWMNGNLPTRAQLELAKGYDQLPPGPCVDSSFCNITRGIAQDFRDGTSIPVEFNFGDGTSAQLGFTDMPDAGVADSGLSETGFICVVEEPQYLLPTCNTLKAHQDEPGAFPAAACEEAPVITQTSKFCSGGQPYAVVDISSDGFYEEKPWQVGSQYPDVSCTEDAGNSTDETIRIVCGGSPASTFEVWGLSRCEAPAPVSTDGPCLEGYELGGAPYPNCIYKGDASGSACPAGFTKPADMNCCAPAKDYPAICPPGQIFWEPSGECELYSKITHVFSAMVELGTCSATGSENANCSLSCPIPGEFPDPTCTFCVKP